MGDFNVKSTTIEKSLDLASGFLSKLFGNAVEEFGLTIGDQVKIFRLKNQIRNFNKIERIIADSNIKIRKVDLKALLPYLDAVGLEDDENLQDAWANLMANYIDSSKNLMLHVYPEILKQISSNELKLLEFLVATTHVNTHFDKQFTEEEFGNLVRLNLIDEERVYNGGALVYSGTISPQGTLPSGVFTLTKFGLSFYKACNRGGDTIESE